MNLSGVTPQGSAPDVYASLPSAAGSSSGTGGLTQSDFLQMLVAELQNQNPLSPMSTASYVNQTSTLSEVAAVEQMTQALSSLFALTSSEAAAGLLGRTVTVSPPGGQTVTGTVTAVSASASGPLLTVSGAAYPLSNVTQVTQGGTTAASAPSGTTATGGVGAP